MALSRPNVRALPRQFLIIHRNSSTNTFATQDNTQRQPKNGPLSGITVRSRHQNLGPQDFSEKHPSLIVCNISGYRPDGPYRDKKAYELLIQSEARLLSVAGTAIEPAKVGISIADICAGSYAYSSILAALFGRQKDPDRRGRIIDISMLESMAEWMEFPMYYTHGDQPGPTPAAKMGYVFEMVLEKPEMAVDERFCDNSLRVKHRDALRETICKVFAAYSAEGILRRLDEAGIANASVNDMQGVWNLHPQLRARQRRTQIQTSAGTVPALFPPEVGPASPIQSMSAFAVAQLAIYSVLVCPAVYLTLCHHRRGLLGWGYLLAFCILRITGGALSIHSSGSGVKIISSVGISPMLLALDGILHEARVYRKRNLNKRLEYAFMAFVHVVVATGVAMVGTGAGGLAGKNHKASDQTNLDVGMALLEASWAILTIWALWTLKDCSEKTISGVKEGKMVDLTLTREDSASQCAIGSANALNASSSTACS
ncbi:hypothetical protein CNMCM8927_005041 [Aspergillus lentulus]|uniref:DUF7702 domain-containing protein n=1 Tax=Aspergillus lentulus TaxID=293939 RepID=A0AAN5YWP5_ASPLE|nr:hypothetical protein CNMCM7927_005151 [Aspergillus lentulus]KAF4209838.1 hypothetical protein CNMCM8927_005041 [Aspergillus lentulus]